MKAAPVFWVLGALAPLTLQAQCDSGTDVLTLPQAREYMVSLINRDRQSQKFGPVTLDLVASGAAQAHTDEMVAYGYAGHFGLDGKKPPERYTEGGGADYDAENAFGPGAYDCSNSMARGAPSGAQTGPIPIAADPHFQKKTIEEIEGIFFNEQPPNDGHRQNTLQPSHNRVGIALSVATGRGSTWVAGTQEFVDHYGTYAPLPAAVHMGDAFDVEGTLEKGYSVQSIVLRQEALPQPMTIAQLNATYSYGAPQTILVSYFPQYDPAHPVSTTDTPAGQSFRAHIAIPSSWQPGLYYVEIWANPAGSTDVTDVKNAIVVSQRTILAGNGTATQWTNWTPVKDAAGQETLLNARKGCSPLSQAGKQAWTVQFRNDDAANGYRIQFELFAADMNRPANWPSAATAIALGAGQIYSSPANATIPNPQGCGTAPHLFYTLAAVPPNTKGL